MNDVSNGGPQAKNDKEPIPLEAGPEKANSPENRPAPVSRAPLNLGGSSAVAAPVAAPAPAPGGAMRAPAPKLVPVRPVAAAGVGDRITGCKTFFTKLHAGAIDFLDEQITQWLKDNPSIVIKMTNVTTGDIQGKKTEPNILLTVWYHGQATKATTSHMG